MQQYFYVWEELRIGGIRKFIHFDLVYTRFVDKPKLEGYSSESYTDKSVIIERKSLIRSRNEEKVGYSGTITKRNS